jgi:hemoglobin
MNDQAVTLYQRLGGSPGIGRLVDEMVALHMENPVAGVRFRAYLDSPERVEEIKRHACAFLEAGTGGPARYSGREMREAHRGMNIAEAEYMAVVDDILQAAGKCGLDDSVGKDLLAIAWSLKGDIMHV